MLLLKQEGMPASKAQNSQWAPTEGQEIALTMRSPVHVSLLDQSSHKVNFKILLQTFLVMIFFFLKNEEALFLCSIIIHLETVTEMFILYYGVSSNHHICKIVVNDFPNKAFNSLQPFFGRMIDAKITSL